MKNTIITSRLKIRPLKESDFSAFRRLLSLPEMALANGSPVNASTQTMKKWFEDDLKSPYAFVIIDLKQDRNIGNIFYYESDNKAEYDLGYFLDPEYWGRGITPEAIKASFFIIKKQGNKLVLWAACLITNKQSIRVLEKLDFVYVKRIDNEKRNLYKLVLNGGQND